MKLNALSLRPFIGARDFAQSRAFYAELGFQETALTPTLSLFATEALGFYLQDAYVPDWIANTMVFLEVTDADQYYQQLRALDLPARYAGARLTPVQTFAWGKECYLYDPCGILWHVGEFAR
ncbi:glyoxalase [Hymenobacter sp. RP-2-7]|uniref:Glyoxalase n=1 Tax=Hymenobacter polaris TaxID=2682546 RepID=A0A7Y0ABF7_9BACT|nr:glyoxalase [Hymenobacter polaris]NML64266.1 glyoxalase [Hymenobacter polaris]